MSDFGSHLAIGRSDRCPLSAVDEKRIRTAARSLQFSNKDRIGPYDEFDLRFGSARFIDGLKGVSIGLSTYFIGDEEGNDGLDPEVINAREGPLAERFAEDLANILGTDYRVEASSGHW